ncbi:MAG: ABC transporter ATP-binding protein [Deltaproteobacteria bacterium]|nr:ABC transporter ATP-binding protein [Deltaproteobacteria bacterium]
MLSIENLAFVRDGHPILKDITVKYAAGRLHGLIGPNGSGKTTLLKNICRIYTPTSGRILLKNRDCRTIPRRRLSAQVALVPQNPRVGFPIRVYDLVTMGRYPHLKRFQPLSDNDRRVVEEALAATNTSALRERSVTELSGGEVQLVMIARALATEAELILLDEPTASLDIGNSLAVMDLLVKLKNQGKTILTALHDLNQARRFCDTVTILKAGRLYFHGPAAEAFRPETMREVFEVGCTMKGKTLEFSL